MLRATKAVDKSRQENFIAKLAPKLKSKETHSGYWPEFARGYKKWEFVVHFTLIVLQETALNARVECVEGSRRVGRELSSWRPR